jgi:hypothetical protein
MVSNKPTKIHFQITRICCLVIELHWLGIFVLRILIKLFNRQRERFGFEYNFLIQCYRVHFKFYTRHSMRGGLSKQMVKVLARGICPSLIQGRFFQRSEVEPYIPSNLQEIIKKHCRVPWKWCNLKTRKQIHWDLPMSTVTFFTNIMFHWQCV